MFKEGDKVEFEVSPEYSTTGIVQEVVDLYTDEEGGGYNQYTVEEDDGTVWTLHRDRIKGAVGPDKPAFEEKYYVSSIP